MEQNAKARSLRELRELVAKLRGEGKTIVLCHGSFESLNAGWIRLLSEAKRHGDVLLATLTTGVAAVDTDSEADPADSRVEVLSALMAVDYVAVAGAMPSVDLIEQLRPHFYVAADEALGQGSLELGEAVLTAWGGKVLRINVPSAWRPSPSGFTQPALSPKVRDFVARLHLECRLDSVCETLESLAGARVLLVGESIIDEYHYCEAMGKAGKEPILAVRHDSTEKFAGGVLSTANQVAEFADTVGLISLLGTQNSHETLVRERLNPRIDAMFHYQVGAPTTVKQRFVEKYPLQKLFEVYTMDDEVDPAVSAAICTRLRNTLPNYDLVIVTDYGHGMITPEVVEVLCNRSRFLAVNTQTNAANQGFNTISKYRRADYVCISEKEFRLEARSRSRDLRVIMSDIAVKLGVATMVATRGERGSLCYRKGTGFTTVPAFTERIVDRIGAGDAVLALTSLLASRGAPLEVVGFLGNAIGALAVEMVGHRGVITRDAVAKKVGTLLSSDTVESIL